MSVACLFCSIVEGEAPSVKVAEDETTDAFLDVNPASRGHLLVAPRTHSTDLLDIDPADLSAVTLTAQRLAACAVAELGADGVNLLNCSGAAAWQTVFHFHLHVVTRYADPAKDRLSLPWQPGVAAEASTLVDLGRRLAAAAG